MEFTNNEDWLYKQGVYKDFTSHGRIIWPSINNTWQCNTLSRNEIQYISIKLFFFFFLAKTNVINDIKRFGENSRYLVAKRSSWLYIPLIYF